MADEKDKAARAEAQRPETAEELMERAAGLLEQRGGKRAKSARNVAAQLRQMVAKLEERK